MPRFYRSKDGKLSRGGVHEDQGIKEIEETGGEVILTPQPLEVVPGLWTTGQVPRINEFETIPPSTDGSGRVIVVEGDYVEDHILCDQSLWTQVEGYGTWVITGCAHSGPVNTLTRVCKLGGFAEIYAYIGGTHLVRRKEEYIKRTTGELRKFNLKLFSPCHCTGFNAMSILSREFPEQFAVNYCGRVFKSGEKPSPMVL